MIWAGSIPLFGGGSIPQLGGSSIPPLHRIATHSAAFADGAHCPKTRKVRPMATVVYGCSCQARRIAVQGYPEINHAIRAKKASVA
jgi:hypothetical protein